ncbi:Ceramide glucosyltransferase [uncultured Pleomorphomonas sp.]|uniref:Ceramide glucosyltransferase n=1 Tax=uncultured Pleomorphomonas sp. TaxID=442121 RepID=A0A212L183_9HYPH|nr:ceramide glucosyltransferase [uncultured Pleomorphomonas sp.]SCM71278.1 Ceramide glucosyltransferase [uncultured Pleomorphomonas sp.]
MTEAVIVLAAALLAAHLLTVGLYLVRLRRRPPLEGAIGRPRVTLLRPVCGREAFDRETLESSFAQDYPDYEVIFCAPSDDDPAVPLVRELIAAHPERRARLFTGEQRITHNPKLNNLSPGWQAAEADWVCMADSNLYLPAGYLGTVVAAWDAETGLVSSPPIGERPDGLAGSLECAFLNGNQARLQFASDSLGNGFAQGKTLFWNRRMLEEAGGLEALGRYLAEDVNATKLVRGAGLKVRLTPLPFAQPIGRRTFREVWSRQLRWSRVRRDGFPWLFAVEPLNGPLVPFVLTVVAADRLDMAAVMLPIAAGLWYGAELVLMRRAGWPSGWRDIVALPLRDALLPVLWLATFLRRDIEWRGNAIAPLDAEERMTPVLVDHD